MKQNLAIRTLMLAVAVTLTTAGPALSKDKPPLSRSLELLRQSSLKNPQLYETVSALLNQSSEPAQPLDRGEPSLMLITYRQHRDKISDVVVEVSYNPHANLPGVLNPGGYVNAQLGSELFSPADNLLALLHRHSEYFGPATHIHRQQRAMQAAVNGDMTLLRQQTVEPLRMVAIMPNPGQFLPSSLRNRVQGIVVDAELSFGEWRGSIALVTEDGETAEQVGNIIAAWRELAVSLADTLAGHSSGKPLRQALQSSAVEIADNQVITTAAVPAMTVVRVSKELTGHVPPCPPGGVCPPNKVAVCHKEEGKGNVRKTLCVAPSAVPAHLAHGDTCGPCP